MFLLIFNENRPKGPETVFRVVNSLKNQQKWPKLDPKKYWMVVRISPFWTNAVCHLHHESIWLVFVRLKAFKKI
jgi:hypothetical protein